MLVKILGPGCANCRTLEKNTRQELSEGGVDASVEQVSDYGVIAGYGVMKTPGLVVDEEVVLSGRVPKPAELARLLADRD